MAAHLAHEVLLAASAKSSSSAAEAALAVGAKQIMSERFADPRFDLSGLATRLGVHRSSLFRRFIATYGVKPSLYLLNLRLQHGLRLIQNSALTVEEIALRSGFADANYFARSIRKATGRTPGAIRALKSRLDS